MDRRWFILAVSTFALGAALAPSDAAWAKDGQDDDGEDDDHSGHGGGDDDGDGDSGHGGDDDGDTSGHGGGGKDDNSGPGNADDDDDHDDGGDGHNGGDNGDHHGGASHDDNSSDATIPLEQMMRIFSRYGDMTVVDVALVRRSGDLEYKFKFIDGDGRVRNAYFDAHTGNPTR